MIDIWTITQTALQGLGLPLSDAHHLVASGATLPDAYLVYQLISDPPAQHADNAETLRRYRMQVSYYSRSGPAGMPDIEGAMKAAGFTRLAGREISYNQETRHSGYALDFYYLDEE